MALLFHGILGVIVKSCRRFEVNGSGGEARGQCEKVNFYKKGISRLFGYVQMGFISKCALMAFVYIVRHVK